MRHSEVKILPLPPKKIVPTKLMIPTYDVVFALNWNFKILLLPSLSFKKIFNLHGISKVRKP